MTTTEPVFKPLSFSIPTELFEPIKRRCRSKDTDRSKYIRDLIRKDLADAGLIPKPESQKRAA